MFTEKEFLALDELLFYMQILEKIKKGTNKSDSLKNTKTIFLMENCIDEIIMRCDLIKFEDTKNYNHQIIIKILSSITNYWVKKWPSSDYYKIYRYNSETKIYDKIDKYPKIKLWELSNYILFFKKEIQKITGNNPYNVVGIENSIETLLEMYKKDIEDRNDEAEPYPEMLNDKKKEYLELKKSLINEKKIEKKQVSKFISDYKYPITSKSSVWTVKNK